MLKKFHFPQFDEKFPNLRKKFPKLDICIFTNTA